MEMSVTSIVNIIRAHHQFTVWCSMQIDHMYVV